MALTLAEQLTSVQAAITAIETNGQSYSIEGVTYTRASLKTLYDREQRILDKITRETAGGGKTVAEF